MISVQEADTLLASFGDPYSAEEVALAEANGRVLRNAIKADRAYPELDRSRMDGIAIAFSTWETGVRTFPVLGMARAGDPLQSLEDLSGCFEIMTGAPCPLGADTVIPYELVSIENAVATASEPTKPGQAGGGASRVIAGLSMHPQGSDCFAGQELVPAGARLNPVRIAAAAANGYARVSVTRRPQIEIVTTGDELVDIEDAPLAHQVRASNGFALRALFESQGSVGLNHAGDDLEQLTARLRQSLTNCDVLLVTGGVSAGKFDEVPRALTSLGVEKIFHKVAQKPGKPLWFGRGPQGQLVFGLPGNPVSALVCARRYVLPLLHTKSGVNAVPGPKFHFSGPLSKSSRRTEFRLVKLQGGPRIEAVVCPVNGSGDFSRLSLSDGFVEIPQDSGPVERSDSPLPDPDLLSFFGWES